MQKIFILICSCSHILHGVEHCSTVHYHVGELAEQWQFPSDHLPIGAQVGDANIAMWNVLDTRYIIESLVRPGFAPCSVEFSKYY